MPTVFRRKGEIDLSGISIDNAYQLSIHDIEQVMKNKVKAIRSFSDPQISRFIKILDFIPVIFMKPIVAIFNRLQYTLNLSLDLIGLPNDRFGSVSITFLASFGIRYAAIPLFPLSRSPITIAVGQAFHSDGRHFLPLGVTFDHRYFDGLEGYHALKKLRYYCQHPDKIA